MLRNKELFDCTLSVGDQKIQAHKIILSACSPFFRGVLRDNPHAHPLLYLKGVTYTDLNSVLNFMYHGEVNMAKEDITSFLAVAEDLKVKGLMPRGSEPPGLATGQREVAARGRYIATAAAGDLKKHHYEIVDTILQSALQRLSQGRDLELRAEGGCTAPGGQRGEGGPGHREEDQGRRRAGRHGAEGGGGAAQQVHSPHCLHCSTSPRGATSDSAQRADAPHLSASGKEGEEGVTLSSRDLLPLTWECSICNKSFNSKLALKKHLRSEHKSDDNQPGTKLYRCLKCQIKLPKAEAVEHKKTHHKENL
jgi:hypothetical protein